MVSTTREYKPDRVSPPGDSLLSILEERGITQAELARRMGRPTKTINEIVKGIAAITPDTALDLESVLGTPAEFWLNRECRYREFVARREREEAAYGDVAWVRQFPLKDLCRLGWLPPLKPSQEAVAHIFSFFGVASVEGWDRTWRMAEAQFRRSRTREGKRHAVAAWLRRGEIEAAKVQCKAFSALRFRAALDDARTLTCEAPSRFQPKLVDLCAEAGVALVFVPELPGVRVHAVTRWASSEKAIVQLSLYYKTDDHLWFSFFHEADHVLSEKRTLVFLDDGADKQSEDERHADRFASEFLIPPKAFDAFRGAGAFDKASVCTFAKTQGICPGIVVGRLQHEGLIEYRSRLNHLKTRFEWVRS